MEIVSGAVISRMLESSQKGRTDSSSTLYFRQNPNRHSTRIKQQPAELLLLFFWRYYFFLKNREGFCVAWGAMEDWVLFTSWWGATNCSAANNWCEGADFNQSGTVELADAIVFFGNWLSGI